MKNLVLISLLAIFAFPSCAQKSEKANDKTTYYLIRHSEKDRSDSSNRDPHLMDKGRQRAENWAKHFKNVKFDEVYSTDYNRTKETATPTAKANGLELQFYDPGNLNIDEFIAKTKGKTVLIVGHSNTTPMFANQLLGKEKYENMSDDDNSKLFKVTIRKGKKTSNVSSIN